jgi:uncharacterized protein
VLLRFRVVNHGSIRDEATFSMTDSMLRGSAPAEGGWQAATLRVAGVYGPNASGKSTLLDALSFLTDAVRGSATSWAERGEFPHQPFLLDDTSAAKHSLYEIDFVLDEVRYCFGFRSDRAGIAEEWLYSYPSGKRRTLYERSGSDFTFGRSLPGTNVFLGKATRPTALFLSSAANNNHEFLRPVHQTLTRHIAYARVSETDRSARLHWTMKLMEDPASRELADALLRFADIGVTGVEIHDDGIPDGLRETMNAILTSLQKDGAGGGTVSVDEVLDSLRRRLKFVHTASGSSRGVGLDLDQESSGTVAWLSLAMPAVDALREGDVFLVDEIDSSLHPNLTSELVAMFKNPEFNTRGAQLIFTSHDTSLLGSLHGKVLEPDEVWLTEKAADGATDLFSAAEFSVRAKDNLERRYLQGRYGAIPIFDRTELHEALAS